MFLTQTNTFINIQPPVDETALLQMWTSKLIWEAGLRLEKKGYAQQDHYSNEQTKIMAWQKKGCADSNGARGTGASPYQLHHQCT